MQIHAQSAKHAMMMMMMLSRQSATCDAAFLLFSKRIMCNIQTRTQLLGMFVFEEVERTSGERGGV
jgi:hypothetical protein